MHKAAYANEWEKEDVGVSDEITDGICAAEAEDYFLSV
jgi:hypothetical protein